jgi:hypothetical protein
MFELLLLVILGYSRRRRILGTQRRGQHVVTRESNREREGDMMKESDRSSSQSDMWLIFQALQVGGREHRPFHNKVFEPHLTRRRERGLNAGVAESHV